MRIQFEDDVDVGVRIHQILIGEGRVRMTEGSRLVCDRPLTSSEFEYLGNAVEQFCLANVRCSYGKATTSQTPKRLLSVEMPYKTRQAQTRVVPDSSDHPPWQYRYLVDALYDVVAGRCKEREFSEIRATIQTPMD